MELFGLAVQTRPGMTPLFSFCFFSFLSANEPVRKAPKGSALYTDFA
jgi:hypothetical protein